MGRPPPCLTSLGDDHHELSTTEMTTTTTTETMTKTTMTGVARETVRGVSVRGGRRDTGDDDERWVEEEELKEQSDRTDVDKVKGVDLVSGDSCWWCRRPRRYVRGVVCRARTAVLGRGVDS